MNTTIDFIKKYISKEYGIDFKIITYGTHQILEYKKNKLEYNLSCDYAKRPEIEQGVEFWSIYYDFMDRGNWHCYGGTYVDNAEKTIDEIMSMWGFIKNKNQTTIFDFIVE